ncbi:hypothetical protein [uncultured Microbulbifer sp.]|uniref:hypothetical protein n=1 Tax=uncultured Microbulbifer sp. TaxID=348147 RepID=UPI0025D313F0|nr:hypothetical protein [uncultured Microbulbifer sp.]
MKVRMRTGHVRNLPVFRAKALMRTGAAMEYSTREMRAEEPPKQDEELQQLRVEYQQVSGKRAYHGWDEATLRQKIEAAKES